MNQKKLVSILIVVVILFGIFGTTAGQEVAVQQDHGVFGIERDVFFGICIVVALLFQGMFYSLRDKNLEILHEAINTILRDKSVRDSAEHVYMTSSLPVQEFIKIMRSGILVLDQLDIMDEVVDPLVDFVEDITDGDGLD